MNELTKLYYDVRPVENELYTYDVRSRSRIVRWHRVNIREHNWAGWCNCEAYDFKYGPKLSRGAPPIDNNRCSHIKRARAYFLDVWLPQLDEQLQKIWKLEIQQNKRPTNSAAR